MAGPIQILVVDDEPSMRKSLSFILEDEGYEVSTAESGEQAVERCIQQQFDVILLDLRMPGLDGIDAFRQIRQQQEKARVIMMTGYSMEDVKQQILKEGAFAFLEKPLDIDRVIQLIN